MCQEVVMRIRIDRSIVYSRISEADAQRTSLDSLLGVGCPATRRAVSALRCNPACVRSPGGSGKASNRNKYFESNVISGRTAIQKRRTCLP
jgi:hypothetical protein